MKKTLVVMAAGMGSRFGGLKQIQEINEYGEFIIDYSIYDAKRAGFTKVVFVIKKEIEDIFKSTIGKRLEGNIEIEYAYQEIEDIPENKKYLVEQRHKPWGTLQALLVTKDKVDDNFVVINADDFYGFDSFKKASEFIDNNKNENTYANVTYPYIVTSSKFGSVKRGACIIDNDIITDMIESKIETIGNSAHCISLENNEEFDIELNHPVSMNMFIFNKSIFKYLEEYFDNYFKNNDDYILNNEILLPALIREKIKDKTFILKNIISDSKYMGITYKDDLEDLLKGIKELTKEGKYPLKLWD